VTLLVTFLLNSFWQIAIVGAVAFALSKALTRMPPAVRHMSFTICLGLCVSLAVLAIPMPAPSSGVVGSGTPSGLVLVPSSVLVSVTLLYAAFLVFRLGRLASAFWLASKLTHTSTAAALPAEAGTALERCLGALAMPRPRIVWSASTSGPLTMGSSIVLPERMRSETSLDVWTAVLGHELVHIRRRDFAWNLLWEIVTLPIAFHPAVAWLRRELDKTREQACDEAVTESLLDSQRYASSLVSVAQHIPVPLPAVYSIGISDGPSLEERIMRIMNPTSTSSFTKATALAGACLLVAVAFGVSSFAFTVAAQGNGEATPLSQRRHGAVEAVPVESPALYDARGKRDPFLSPLGTQTVEPVGFDVESLALQGIVETPSGFTAMLQGPDRKTYFVKRGERFFNGTLVAIDGASLTFAVQTRDLFGASSSR